MLAFSLLASIVQERLGALARAGRMVRLVRTLRVHTLRERRLVPTPRVHTLWERRLVRTLRVHTLREPS